MVRHHFRDLGHLHGDCRVDPHLQQFARTHLRPVRQLVLVWPPRNLLALDAPRKLVQGLEADMSICFQRALVRHRSVDLRCWLVGIH